MKNCAFLPSVDSALRNLVFILDYYSASRNVMFATSPCCFIIYFTNKYYLVWLILWV